MKISFESSYKRYYYLKKTKQKNIRKAPEIILRILDKYITSKDVENLIKILKIMSKASTFSLNLIDNSIPSIGSKSIMKSFKNFKNVSNLRIKYGGDNNIFDDSGIAGLSQSISILRNLSVFKLWIYGQQKLVTNNAMKKLGNALKAHKLKSLDLVLYGENIIIDGVGFQEFVKQLQEMEDMISIKFTFGDNLTNFMYMCSKMMYTLLLKKPKLETFGLHLTSKRDKICDEDMHLIAKSLQNLTKLKSVRLKFDEYNAEITDHWFKYLTAKLTFLENLSELCLKLGDHGNKLTNISWNYFSTKLRKFINFEELDFELASKVPIINMQELNTSLTYLKKLKHLNIRLPNKEFKEDTLIEFCNRIKSLINIETLIIDFTHSQFSDKCLIELASFLDTANHINEFIVTSNESKIPITDNGIKELAKSLKNKINIIKLGISFGRGIHGLTDDGFRELTYSICAMVNLEILMLGFFEGCHKLSSLGIITIKHIFEKCPNLHDITLQLNGKAINCSSSVFIALAKSLVENGLKLTNFNIMLRNNENSITVNALYFFIRVLSRQKTMNSFKIIITGKKDFSHMYENNIKSILDEYKYKSAHTIRYFMDLTMTQNSLFIM